MVYKHTDVLPITERTTHSNAERWLKIVKYGESGVVVQIQDDCEYRVGEILKNKQLLKEILGPYYRKYLLTYVPIDKASIDSAMFDELLKGVRARAISLPKNITDLATLTEYLVNQGYSLGFFVTGVGELSYEVQYDELRVVEKLLQTAHNVSVILFSDRDVANEKYSQLVDKCSLLFDHVEIYPLYSRVDALQFVKYNESMWQMSLSDKVNQEIVDKCGGYLWLISHVQRQLRDDFEVKWGDLVDDAGLLIKLESIMAKLDVEARDILRGVESGSITKSQKQTPAFQFLIKIGLIAEKDGVFDLGIPLLSLVFRRIVDLEEIRLVEGSLYVGTNNITKEMSESEGKLLVYLVKNKQKVVSREGIAQVLWKDKSEKQYSDWAMDRVISRLRQKMKQVGISPNLLRTVKRRGYIFG